MSGEKTGFAYSDEIILPELLTAAQSARAIAQSGNEGGGHQLAPRQAKALYGSADPVDSLGNEEKIALLREVDKFCRAADPRVSQVIVSLSAVFDTILVAAADGTLSADVRPLVRLNVQVIAEQNGRREQGSAGGGGRYGYRECYERSAHSRAGSRTPGYWSTWNRAAPAAACTRSVGQRIAARQSVMVLKATSIARAPRHSPAAWATRWPPKARWSTVERYRPAQFAQRRRRRRRQGAPC
jgi:predicted Zn-dependent protease